MNLGSLLAALVLYLALLLLDVEWNLCTWRFRLSLDIATLLAVMVGALVATWYLAGASRDSATRLISMFECLTLLALAIYAFPSEPLSTGLFARLAPSPFWYRGGRVAIMALPVVFWSVQSRRSRRAK